MAYGIQATFAGGEFSPALGGRVDIQKYSTGLSRARNVLVMPQGGVRNRPGTKMVAAAKDSTHQVRLIPFVAGSGVAYVIEMGHQYARFYTSDAQVLDGFGAAYEISHPYSGTELFDIKFAQAGNTLYLTHGSYAPRQLVFTSSASWALSTVPFTNGPFRLMNLDTSKTITPSGLSGSITLTAASALFDAGHVGALWELVATVAGQTAQPSLTSSVTNWIVTGSTWAATTTGTWSGTVLIQTSPDNVTWTTVSSVTTNTTVSGSTGFTQGYIRAIVNSALAFSGSATVALTGDGNSSAATAVSALNATVGGPPGEPCGSNATITITGVWTATIKLQKSTDAGVTWTDLASYAANQAGTVQATGETSCLIRALVSAYTSGTATVTVDGTAANAPTRSFTVSTANQSQAIQCGSKWAAITTGAWTGLIRVEISQDQGANWSLVRALQAAGTSNFDVSGDTGTSQCLIRVSADPTVAFSGTANVSLTSSTFDWKGVVKITARASSTSATATVQALSNTNNTGLANTSATWQHSEGAWSTYRGFPTAIAFFQARMCLGGTATDPQGVWCSQTSIYTEMAVSSPLVDSDAISIVLPSRTVNIVRNLLGVGPALIAMTSDAEFSIAPGQNGVLSPTSSDVSQQGSRGSASVAPVVIGNEAIYMQQMGTVARNLIFQFTYSGFVGDDINPIARHLFTGYTISEMAYQQEPDSIVWMIRSDGKMLSLTYMREQEVNAWTWHDSVGTFESIVTIPSPTNGINEPWVVYNLSGTRYVCRMVKRDQGTAAADQFFVDCGLTYSGVAATVITGLSHLNGKAVSVLADGNVVTGLTVAAGQITLSTAATQVHVGLPYVSDVATLKIEAPDQKGTLQGRRVAIPDVMVRFWSSRGGYIGADQPSDDGVSGLDPIPQRSQADAYGAAIPLKTDDYLQNIPGGFDYGAHVFFRQVDPLPFAILGFMPQVVAGER